MEDVKISKNCLFYTGMDVQLWHYDYCTLKGDKWEDREECHCDNCSAYISTSWLKTLGREMAAEKKGDKLRGMRAKTSAIDELIAERGKK